MLETYKDWAELDLNLSSHSVLHKFSNATGLVVANAVVEELVHQLNTGTTALTCDAEVKWCMEVLSYALALPLNSNYTIISNSVVICCDWLTCLTGKPIAGVPKPLSQRSHFYSTEILNQLGSLFAFQWVPGIEIDTIKRRVRECERVLHRIKSVVPDTKAELQSTVLPEMLKFMLGVAQNLLAFPFEFDAEIETLCALAMRVLLFVWLQACVHHYPAPAYWKTLNSCDLELLSGNCSNEAFSQTWYRFLMIFGNLGRFLKTKNADGEYAFNAPSVVQPSESSDQSSTERPFLVANHWSYCFFIAMVTVDFIVSGLMGFEVDCLLVRREQVPSIKETTPSLSSLASSQSLSQSTISQTSSFLRAAIKSGLPGAAKTKETKQPSAMVKPSQTTTTTTPPPPPPSGLATSDIVQTVLKEMLIKPTVEGTFPSDKPAVNSMLRLFGSWLFEACATGEMSTNRQMNFQSTTVKGQEKELIVGTLERSIEARAARAVAIITLSKIFCHKLSDEELLVEHVGRFYSVIRETIAEGDPMIVSSLLVYSTNLFRVNLRGCEAVWPHLLSAVEKLFSETNRNQLMAKESCMRHACLRLLSASVTFSFCFGDPSAKEKNELIGHACQLHSILCTMLTEETDSQNLQLCVNLLAAYCFGLLFWRKSGGETPQGQGGHETVGAALFLLAEVLGKNKLSDFAVCLSVYDSLSTLIAIFPAKGSNELFPYEQLLFTVCKVIQSQLALPSRSHSRDLHSTIVAAFGFLENMLIRLPSLLINKDCLQRVCEIIELGIYGCEGHQFNVSEKKPASQRVHDAADQLLRCMFSRVGDSFEPITSLQDENYLIDSMADNSGNRMATVKFLYVLYNSFILAVSELDGLNGGAKIAYQLYCTSLMFFYMGADETRETALIIRSPLIMATCQLYELLTRSEEEGKPLSRPKGRPRPELRRPVPTFFPPEAETAPRCKADLSIPEMKMDDQRSRMLSLIRSFEHRYKEERARQRSDADDSETVDITPQRRGTGRHHARLLLYDLGVTQFTDCEPQFQVLDSDASEFSAELAALDRLPSRHVSTVHIFYVKKGQCSTSAILKNSENVDETDKCFLAFLTNLGEGVAVGDDALWTGHWSTAYQTNCFESTLEEPLQSRKRYVFDGKNHLLYWSSPSVEMAFLLPSTATNRFGVGEDHPTRPPRLKSSSFPDTDTAAPSLTKQSSGKRTEMKQRRVSVYQDYKFLVVWVERHEDIGQVPIDELVEYTDTGEKSSPPPVTEGLYIVYVCRLVNGLYRLDFQCPHSKLGCPGPIVDGLVLNLDLLAPFVRHTVLNAATRRRLEQEGWKIFKSKMSCYFNWSTILCYGTFPLAELFTLSIWPLALVLHVEKEVFARLAHNIRREVLTELCSRFLMNIPDEEKVDPVRVCFQIEQAHWFYVDFFCGGECSCSLREFMSAIFAHCPFLRPYAPQVTDVMGRWRAYKSGVPLFGAILVNESLSEVLLVQGYYAKSSWGFPKGKINENESPEECAVREVLEEVGYDISHKIAAAPFAIRRLADSNLGLFLIRGVEANFRFLPQTRNEIRRIKWFPIDSLPCNRNDTSIADFGFNPRGFFMVFPFVRFIKKYTTSVQQAMLNGIQQIWASARVTDGRKRRKRRRKCLTAHPRMDNESLLTISDEESIETSALLKAEQLLHHIQPQKLFCSPKQEEAISNSDSSPETNTTQTNSSVELSMEDYLDTTLALTEETMENELVTECANEVKEALPHRTAPKIRLAKAWQHVSLNWKSVLESLQSVTLESANEEHSSSSPTHQATTLDFFTLSVHMETNMES
ncbi:DCP2 and NUDIX domain containing protein [Trichuris trichiura]|uniref:mRNA-decapping enzyme 2 n=1 Tax=Trichuris trichiura TaxID=36087 RepID=A0A077YWF3_TRITR|nr:DCP2 and NUDIX domain containing protein [Trichuris trichiura]